MNNQYIIIPGCCDLNRGDQALGWETRRIAEDAGFRGVYSILAEREEPIQQSIMEGYRILTPVLEHPSRKFKNKDNIFYNRRTKIMWGLVALKDLFNSLMLLNCFTRKAMIGLISDSETARTIEAFNRADAVFMKGGGLIQSHGGLLATYATYYRVFHILLAESLNKPVYILPNSFGPFEGPGVRSIVRIALKKCKLVTAREQRSADELKKELNLNVPVFPDLAFYLKNGSMNRDRLIEKCRIPDNMSIVAITLRPYRFPDSDNPEAKYREFKKEMRDFILWIYSQGYMPLLVEHTYAITSHENDGSCIADVVKGIPDEKYRICSDRTMNCREIKSVYGCCDYIIGTRFHSLIFSLSNRVPGIAISYDGYKTIGIMKDMGLEKYVIDISKVRASILEKMFTSIIRGEHEIEKKIDKYINNTYSMRKKLIESMERE